MNFIRHDFRQLSSDTHTHIHTHIHAYRQTDRQTDRQTESTEIIIHAASRVLNNQITSLMFLLNDMQIFNLCPKLKAEKCASLILLV